MLKSGIIDRDTGSQHTLYPTRIRVYKEPGIPGWHVDGHDSEGRYTEMLFTLPTWEDAIGAISDFASNYHSLWGA